MSSLCKTKHDLSLHRLELTILNQWYRDIQPINHDFWQHRAKIQDADMPTFPRANQIPLAFSVGTIGGKVTNDNTS